MTFVKLPSGTIINLSAVCAFESNLKGLGHLPGADNPRGYVTFNNGEDALQLRDGDARALSAYLDTQAVAIDEDGMAIVTPENAQVTPPEPTAAELIADLHRLDDMRLIDASADRASSALDGTLPGNLDYLNALLVRGFAIPNPAGGERIIITTAGRAELARITSQGEV